MYELRVFLPELAVDYQRATSAEEISQILTNCKARKLAFFDEILTGYILLNKQKHETPKDLSLDLSIRGNEEQLVNVAMLKLEPPLVSSEEVNIYRFSSFIQYPKIKFDDPLLEFSVQGGLEVIDNRTIEPKSTTCLEFYPADRRNILSGIAPISFKSEHDSILLDSLIKNNKIDKESSINTENSTTMTTHSFSLKQIQSTKSIPVIRLLNLRVRNTRIGSTSVLSTIDIEPSSKAKNSKLKVELTGLYHRFQGATKPKFTQQFPIIISKDDRYSFTFQLDSHDLISYKSLVEINYTINKHKIKTKLITNIDFISTHKAQVTDPSTSPNLKRSSTSSFSKPTNTALSQGLTVKFIGAKTVALGNPFKLKVHIQNNTKKNRNLVMVFNSFNDGYVPNLPKIKSLIQPNLTVLKYYLSTRVKSTGVLSLVNEVHFKAEAEKVFESEISLIGLELGIFNMAGVKLVDVNTGESMSCDKLLEIIVQ